MFGTMAYNRCTIPKTGVFAEEGVRIIHQIVYIYSNICVCICCSTNPFCSRSELGRRFFCSVTTSDSCLVFTWRSSPTTWFGNSFPTSTTHGLSNTKNQN